MRQVADRALAFRSGCLDQSAELLHARAERLGGGIGQLLQRLRGLSGTAFDRAAEMLGAGGQELCGRLGTRFNLAGHRFGASDEELLKPPNARIEIVGNFHGVDTERLVDVIDLLADAFCELGAAHVDDIGDVRDALVQRADYLLAALGHGLGDVQHSRSERFVERLCAAIQGIAEACELLIKTGGDLRRLGGHAGIEIVQVIAHCGRDLLGTLTQPFNHLAAIRLHRPVELGQMARDKVAQRCGIARDPFSQLGTAVIEHVLEGLQPCGDHFAHRIAPVADHLAKGVHAVAQLVTHPLAALQDCVSDARAGLFQLGNDIAAAQAEVKDERIAGVLEGSIHLLDAARNGLGELISGLDREVRHLLRAIGHHIQYRRGLLGEALGDALEPHRHHVLKIGSDLGELIADVIGLEIQRGGQTVAGASNRLRGLPAGCLEPFEQVAPALAQRLDHCISGVAESARDVLGLLGQGMRDPPRRLVDLFGNELVDLRDIVTQIEMNAVDRVTDLGRLADERVALAAQVLQQRADTHFVVVVGMFECRYLVGHQRLELAGAGQRAFDAVAHGGDFAPDRLADRDYRFSRDRFRLGEAHGDFSHGLRNEPQFLGPPGHVREHVKEDDGSQEDSGEHRQYRSRQSRGRQRSFQLREVHPTEDEADHHPRDGENRGDLVGGSRRAALQAAQDLSDRFPIVVRRPAQCGLLLRRVHLRCEFLVLGRRGTRPAPRRLEAPLFGNRCLGLRLHRRRSAGLRVGRHLVPNRKRILNRRQRCFGRILDLLGSVRHVVVASFYA